MSAPKSTSGQSGADNIEPGNDRIYQTDDGQWYIRNRRNASLGPFTTCPEAQHHLHQQMRTWDTRVTKVSLNRLIPTKFLRRSVFRQT